MQIYGSAYLVIHNCVSRKRVQIFLRYHIRVAVADLLIDALGHFMYDGTVSCVVYIILERVRKHNGG